MFNTTWQKFNDFYHKNHRFLNARMTPEKGSVGLLLARLQCTLNRSEEVPSEIGPCRVLDLADELTRKKRDQQTFPSDNQGTNSFDNLFSGKMRRKVEMRGLLGREHGAEARSMDGVQARLYTSVRVSRSSWRKQSSAHKDLSTPAY